MTNQHSATPIDPENQSARDEPELNQDDLDSVAGGTGPVYDIYRILSESWTEIKEGFNDAMND